MHNADNLREGYIAIMQWQEFLFVKYIIPATNKPKMLIMINIYPINKQAAVNF